MNAKLIKDKILLKEKQDVLRWYLFGKLLERGIRPKGKDLDVLLELYEFGGYSNSDEQNNFIQSCITNNLKKSEQSVRNTLSEYTSLNVLCKPKNTTLHFNEEVLPKASSDAIFVQALVHHKF